MARNAKKEDVKKEEIIKEEIIKEDVKKAEEAVATIKTAETTIKTAETEAETVTHYTANGKVIFTETVKAITKEMEEVKALIFKATRPLDEGEFKLLSEMVRHEEEKSGIKIILMPYSCGLEEDKENKNDK